MRKSYVALLLMVGAAALTANLAIAQESGIGDQVQPRLTNANISAQLRSRAANLGVSSTPSPNDTVWVGYSGLPGATNYWKVGKGPNRPTQGPGVGTDGVWSWETPVHGDSMQGWWSIRCFHANASGAVRVDVNRPWWAIEIGNSANYVINEGRSHDYTTNLPGNRTFGVVGVWHSDPGNTGAGAGKGVAWTPLAGTKSAWMGLRNHGDVTVSDPLTNSAFNVDVLQMSGNQANTTTVGNGASDRFPGYGSQMDQMLYRDIDVSGLGANNLTLGFNFSTFMSLGKTTTTSTRVGWFDGDHLSTAAGNFISAEAGSPANAQAPVDSFQVYVGEPVEGTWKGSDNVTRPIYDNLRRWFNEVLNKDKRMWVFSADSINNNVAQSIIIPNAAVNALKSSGNKLRIVFRVHTNRGFDDQGTAFNSGGAGAAQLDNVTVNQGAGPVTIGDFEGSTAANDIDNSSSLTAEQAWKSTGKPPGIMAHPHALSDLTFEDLCGDVNSVYRICDLKGTVISMGDHDNFERAGAPIDNTNHSEDEAGQWGIVSPTVNLVALSKTKNGWDLTGEEATATQDYYIWYAIYAGIFDIFSTGDSWQSGMQNYPSTQPLGGPAPGTPEWGAIRTPGFLNFNPDKQCFYVLDGSKQQGLVRTSNASGVPDSIRIFFRRIQTCYRFGVTAGCSPTDGCYLDDMALVIVDGNPQAMSVDIWQWFNDSFPANEDGTLPGTANFDTAAALVRTGLNTTQTVGATALRFDVPGDSISVIAPGDSLRIDMIFRIRPGVGNYLTIGNASSGLRKVPTGLATVTPGDGTFWGTYEVSPGEKAQSGAVAAHAGAPSGWNSLVWNAARCDTQETNFFPVMAKAFIPVDIGGSAWQSTIHENDPNYSTLGVTKNICFVVDTLGSLNDPNVTCTSIPAWVTTVPASRTGYNGVSTTKELTSILPDGIFTPGTHVEYFFRRENLKGPTAGQVDMCPDTTIVFPQELEGSTDAHRWQEFSVLPDRWKDNAFGGGGAACMLYVDWNDRRGDERGWISVADSIGATRSADRGGHNGWSAPGNIDNSNPNTSAAINSPIYRVYKNKSAGSTFDMYGVKASESLNTGSASLGARFSVRDASAANKVKDKYDKHAPTLAMLQAYYKVVMALFGDLNSDMLGPFTDKTADDVREFQDYMLGATTANKVGVWLGGNGIVEANFNTSNATFAPEVMQNLFFGNDLLFPGYRSASGKLDQVTDLIPTADLVGTAHASDIYGVRNACTYTQDVLFMDLGDVPEVVVGAEYQNVGANGPYVAVSVKPATVTRPWIGVTEGYDILTVTSRYDVTSYGRLAFYYNALSTVFSAISGCSIVGTPAVTLDVPNLGNGSQFVNFMNLRNNPLKTGMAAVHFGLAKSDRVEIKVYDVTGRLVRNLADRQFPAGEHTITWDGVNDHGQQVARGVYFTQVKYLTSRFVDAKKLIVLK
ncbi:MAG TPA: FlgD immunoglobulin-like domain containing protein [Candidatus Saccharimonadaceae bacterium]|nr:FlgD immunoglobulin-like domain containing protein [Candidatus Saccharimonadaceae bacterium]